MLSIAVVAIAVFSRGVVVYWSHGPFRFVVLSFCYSSILLFYCFVHLTFVRLSFDIRSSFVQRSSNVRAMSVQCPCNFRPTSIWCPFNFRSTSVQFSFDIHVTSVWRSLPFYLTTVAIPSIFFRVLPSTEVYPASFIPVDALYSLNRRYYIHTYLISYFSNRI